MTAGNRRYVGAMVLALFCAGLGGFGCGGNQTRPRDAGLDVAGDATDSGDDAAPALTAVPGPSRYALVDEDVVLDGSASVGATLFQWNLGDGRASGDPTSDPVAHAIYAAPGRYRAVLTVFDDTGHQRSATVVVSVTFPPIAVGVPSGPLALIPGSSRIAVVVPDANQVIVLERTTDDHFRVVDRVATAAGPRTIAAWNGWLAIACAGGDRLDLIPIDGRSPAQSVAFTPGARPFGVAGAADALYVTLQTSGSLARIVVDAAGVAQIDRIVGVLADARGVSLLPDGRVAVTRWRSPDARGEVAVHDPASGATAIWPLAFDDRVPTDGASGGVPSYLEQIVVSPDGRQAVVPSLAANFRDGGFRNGRRLTFESTVRAIASFLDLPSGIERVARRVLFDDRGFASAAVFSPRGDYLYVAMRGNRTVERYDVLAGSSAGTLTDVGFAPDSVVITADGRFLLVNASLSREVTIYDLDNVQQVPTPIERIVLIESEPLETRVLRGKQLFNDCLDPRLAMAGYIACSHCHLDGDSDLRTWDFTDRGEGLRNTISLLGRSGGDGPLHWSGNFDEVQDFENDIRGAFGGMGLIPDADFYAGGRDKTLGAPKAGISAELDDLAAYVGSLATLPPSPVRSSTGALSSAAARGRLLFESAETACTMCHMGARLSDSAFVTPGQPRLHDVGTLGTGSGKRLGGSLVGIDTPTLHGLWLSPPYLHDGSAPDLRAVLRDRNTGDRHGKTTQLSDVQIADLVEYLLSLDGRKD